MSTDVSNAYVMHLFCESLWTTTGGCLPFLIVLRYAHRENLVPLFMHRCKFAITFFLRRVNDPTCALASYNPSSSAMPAETEPGQSPTNTLFQTSNPVYS
ncbi:hypothetical protein CRM22_011362 [Opisthorchis felineus]|uniref:Uncharacterized protein n=1 Tax=Opisthorchis felineus TaxID=147828 RepID=A0A4V3S7E9_OPIFE|nr:hypothetical protein CRM22_011362 [Opisthorchis felineus]